MMLSRIGLVALFAAPFLFWPGISSALEMDKFALSIGAWDSHGRTDWNHDASNINPQWGNPTSELKYKNIDSTIVELGLQLGRQEKAQLRLALGLGSIDDGTLVDDDYVSDTGSLLWATAVTGANRISRTHSEITGDDLAYISAEYSPEKLYYKGSYGSLRLWGGYQYWQEEYVAKGIEQVECTSPLFCNPAGTISLPNTVVISNKVKWHSWFVGLDGLLHLAENFSLNANMTYAPLVYLDNNDTHHLRSDLRQDPSFSMNGYGSGYNLQADLVYQFLSNAEVFFGYRFWKREVSNEDWKAHVQPSGTVSAKLNDFNTRRSGIKLGLNFFF